MANRTSTIFTVASATVLAGLVAYVVYFDYRRRNDTEFRKKLRKDKKRVTKQHAEAEEAAKVAVKVSPEDLKAALAKVRDEEVPTSPEDKEQYFMTQVGLGEQLCAQGPNFYLPAALSFYRALRVYPSPVELIVIYQKTVPEPIFNVVMELMNMDVKARVEGYYNVFPRKSMNVSVRPAPSDSLRKILVVEKDFKAGEVIYKEEPTVAVLDADLQKKGTHCSHCLRDIQKGMAICPTDRLDSVYCSKDCQVRSKVQSQNLLFGLDSVLPPELDNGTGRLTEQERDRAQTQFAAYIKNSTRAAPLLVARFIARQVAIETAKMMPKKEGPLADEFVNADKTDAEYSLYDHVERLRFLDGKVSDEETKLLKDVLAAALPGLEQSLTSERHAMYIGKMTYNAIGVCFAGGRDDKPTPKERPEDQERTRTPYGTTRQIGSGLYPVSSYIAHSCAPSARPSFSSGTSELHLIATRNLEKGEEVTMAYVDVTQHPNETLAEARRRRRIELARGWRFKCECTRCVEELAAARNAAGEAGSESESDVGVQKDESKVEDVVQRVERGAKLTMPAAGPID
ncbi:MAS20-domain-containing protein [Sparassis crispa]|uniref:Mitochondrial import receptor subunit TOM20 n=1 Tax=Sparassis crispa TaxID=139825 RepID=A0A401GCZ8_9APHY|nr:MAS20-domain-containing protein [Sparassis crispa]GBE80037.1 MAS20-domain-containing protein [Sparassis crispa]